MYRERKCSVSQHGCYVVGYGPQIKTLYLQFKMYVVANKSGCWALGWSLGGSTDMYDVDIRIPWMTLCYDRCHWFS